ncbi:MAG: LPS export ABC transporter periplasmic protein LptC [Treponema sp.]|jgi:LPS export ABC transporter protein LptC|nr:LPS export ABC transporter periplasmic protein LptC [Treponema sp.]
MKRHITALFILSPFFFFSACSFDYSSMGSGDQGQPDVVMDDVEYVRVRNGDPLVRFRAEHAERYENKQTMELRNFSFEQFGSHGEEINAEGWAGAASVELESGNIRLDDQVRISVDSEDIIIETDRLSWKDKEKILSGDEADEVIIRRSDGTNFTGQGFRADARNRTWEFATGISGTYVHEDEEEEEAADAEETEEEAAAAAGEDGEEAAADAPARETETGGGAPAGEALP